MSMFKRGIIRFGSMVTWGGSKGRNPTQRPRHLLTIRIRTRLSNVSSTSLIDFAKPVVVHSLCGSQCNANWILDVFLRYFMRELLPLGVESKPQFPLFLTSWVDKTSAQCMYTMSQTHTWSIPHLKAGCWYIECGKTICPVEEEEVKITCDKADSRGAVLVSDQVEVPEEENEVDLSLLPEKERNKILLQREREAHKAKDKAEKEAQKAKDKEAREAKKGGRASKSKTVAAPSSPLLLIETSTTSPSQNPRKWDASLAHLSVSRLQQLAPPPLMDSARGALHVQEFFFSGSLLSTDVYYIEEKAFPKEWVDMKAFLKTVYIFSC
jgi:hypothetical protein